MRRDRAVARRLLAGLATRSAAELTPGVKLLAGIDALAFRLPGGGIQRLVDVAAKELYPCRDEHVADVVDERCGRVSRILRVQRVAVDRRPATGAADPQGATRPGATPPYPSGPRSHRTPPASGCLPIVAYIGQRLRPVLVVLSRRAARHRQVCCRRGPRPAASRPAAIRHRQHDDRPASPPPRWRGGAVVAASRPTSAGRR
jgi:hypothetical protein